MMMDDIKNSRKRRRSPSPENLHQAKRAAVAQAHLNGTSKREDVLRPSGDARRRMPHASVVSASPHAITIIPSMSLCEQSCA